MATQVIKIKRNVGPGAKVPGAGELEQGELAVDLVDGKLYVGTGTDPADEPITLVGDPVAVANATTTTVGVVSVPVDSGLTVDGNGALAATLKTVAGVAPDGTGDVALTAADIDALPADGTATQATKLVTPREISVAGGATAAGVAFDGTANIALSVTALDYTVLDEVNFTAPVVPGTPDKILTNEGWQDPIGPAVVDGGTY